MTNWKKENKEGRCDRLVEGKELLRLIELSNSILISNKANIYILYAFSVLL